MIWTTDTALQCNAMHWFFGIFKKEHYDDHRIFGQLKNDNDKLAMNFSKLSTMYTSINILDLSICLQYP